VVVKRRRQWTTADKDVLNLAIVVILSAVMMLLLPLPGWSSSSSVGQRHRAAGGDADDRDRLVTCACVAFRQFAKWVFLITSGVFGLIIIGLFAYAAIKSPGSYDAPALAQAETPTRAISNVAATASPVSEAVAPVAATTVAASEPAASPPPAHNPGASIAYEALTSRYGPQRVVRVTVPAPDNKPPDTSLANRAHESLSPLAPSWYVSRQSDHLECILAPVEDFEGFVGKVRSVASPSDVDFDQRTLTVKFPAP
jgi:hypothetical protein